MIPSSAKAVAIICGIAFAATFGSTISSHAFDNSRQASTVRILSGDQHGSGVIIKHSEGGYWVITNQHVLDGESVHCIESSGGERYLGHLVPLASNKDEADLALLWFNAGDKEEQVAELAYEQSESGEAIELVIATGYPATQEYVERPGLTIPLLGEPLEGGYTLTYTSDIDKGMSGGGVFDENNRLIGLNAAHQEPLWEASRNYQSGEPVIAKLNQQLDLVALGLNAEQVRMALVGVNENFKVEKNSVAVSSTCADEAEE